MIFCIVTRSSTSCLGQHLRSPRPKIKYWLWMVNRRYRSGLGFSLLTFDWYVVLLILTPGDQMVYHVSIYGTDLFFFRLGRNQIAYIGSPCVPHALFTIKTGSEMRSSQTCNSVVGRSKCHWRILILFLWVNIALRAIERHWLLRH